MMTSNLNRNNCLENVFMGIAIETTLSDFEAMLENTENILIISIVLFPLGDKFHGRGLM